MKNKQILTGILATMLVFGFLAVGCSTGNETDGEQEQSTTFEGRWKYDFSQVFDDEDFLAANSFCYVFSGNNFSTEYAGPFFEEQGMENESGTFEYLSAVIKFTFTQSSTRPSLSVWQPYTLSGDTLTLSQSTDNQGDSGTFIKQP
jgi:hypothetical protein